jgi:hypothetical protein
MNNKYWLILLAILISCGKTGVDPQTDPTNEDAIYNIIRYDSPAAFNLDLFDLSVPDTNAVLAKPYQPLHWWRNIHHDSLDIDIRIHYPNETDSVGTVPDAQVTIVKYFWGTLEIIALDTTGGGAQRIRMSKPFDMKGTITASFEKYGFDYNSRRGWRLSGLSDAVFTPINSGQALPIPRVTLQTSNSIIHINPAAIKTLHNLPSFTPGESLTVNISMSDTSNFVALRYPAGNSYATREIPSAGGGNFIGGFTFPRAEVYGHFLIDAITMPVLTDTLHYHPNAMGVIYKAR